jgi:hypothetical protein
MYMVIQYMDTMCNDQIKAISISISLNKILSGDKPRALCIYTWLYH